MNWIKEVIADIAVTCFIVAAVYLQLPWMYWVITGYTVVLLFSKAVILFADQSLQLLRKTRTNAPSWFNHLLYAVNTSVLLLIQWWYVAGGWLIIWVLSYLAQRKLGTTPASKSFS